MNWWTYIISGAVMGLLCGVISAILRKNDRERIKALQKDNEAARLRLEKEAINLFKVDRDYHMLKDLLDTYQEESETEIEEWKLKYQAQLDKSIKLAEELAKLRSEDAV